MKSATEFKQALNIFLKYDSTIGIGNAKGGKIYINSFDFTFARKISGEDQNKLKTLGWTLNSNNIWETPE